MIQSQRHWLVFIPICARPTVHWHSTWRTHSNIPATITHTHTPRRHSPGLTMNNNSNQHTHRYFYRDIKNRWAIELPYRIWNCTISVKSDFVVVDFRCVLLLLSFHSAVRVCPFSFAYSFGWVEWNSLVTTSIYYRAELYDLTNGKFFHKFNPKWLSIWAHSEF